MQAYISWADGERWSESDRFASRTCLVECTLGHTDIFDVDVDDLDKIRCHMEPSFLTI